MSPQATPARFQLTGITAALALVAALVSCGWGEPELSLSEASDALTLPVQAVAASAVRASRFADEHAHARRALVDPVPREIAMSF